MDRTLFEVCLIACSDHYRLPSLKRHLTMYHFCKDQQVRGDMQKKSVDFTRQRGAREQRCLSIVCITVNKDVMFKP